MLTVSVLRSLALGCVIIAAASLSATVVGASAKPAAEGARQPLAHLAVSETSCARAAVRRPSDFSIRTLHDVYVVQVLRFRVGVVPRGCRRTRRIAYNIQLRPRPSADYQDMYSAAAIIKTNRAHTTRYVANLPVRHCGRKVGAPDGGGFSKTLVMLRASVKEEYASGTVSESKTYYTPGKNLCSGKYGRGTR